MIWRRATLSAAPALVAWLEERLLVDGYERIVTEREPGARRARLSVFAANETELPSPEALARWLVEAQSAGLDPEALRWEPSAVADEDWDAGFRAHFAARNLGPLLRIEPSWEGAPRPHDAPLPGPGARLSIRLEPGQAFGTGEHPTTAACLGRLGARLAERAGETGPRCLDVGSGTGILTIAARLWGAAGAIGYDIDSACIANAYLNAELNGLAGQLEFRWGEPEGLAPAGHDLILCNLFLGPILRYLPRLDAALAPGGGAILSGFLARQAPGVREAAEARGWTLLGEEDHEGWIVQEWQGPR